MASSNLIDFAYLYSSPFIVKHEGKIGLLDILDVKDEQRRFEEALSGFQVKYKIDVATLENLSCLSHGCKVLHFTGHASERKDLGLVIDCGYGEGSFLNCEDLKNLVRDSNIELVFIGACHSKHVAEAFLDAGVPHVVASKDVIDDVYAKKFMKHFYLQLLHLGKTVSAAFEQTKIFLSTYLRIEKRRNKKKNVDEKYALPPKEGIISKKCVKEDEKYVLLPKEGKHDVQIFQKVDRGKPTNVSVKKKGRVNLTFKKLIGRSSYDHFDLMRILKSLKIFNIYGPSLIGKTAFVNNIAYYLYDRRIAFPGGVFSIQFDTDVKRKEDMEVGELAAELFKCIGVDAIGMKDSNKWKDILENYLGQEKTLLVFDAIHSVTSKQSRKNIVKIMKHIVNYTNTKILISSRDKFVDLEDSWSCELNPLPEKEIENLLATSTTGLTESFKATLMEYIKGSPGLCKIAIKIFRECKWDCKKTEESLRRKVQLQISSSSGEREKKLFWKKFDKSVTSNAEVSFNDFSKHVNKHFESLLYAKRKFSEEDLRELLDFKSIGVEYFNLWWKHRYWPLIKTMAHIINDWDSNKIMGFSRKKAEDSLKENREMNYVIRLSSSEMSKLVVVYMDDTGTRKTLISCSERGEFSLDVEDGEHKPCKSLSELIHFHIIKTLPSSSGEIENKPNEEDEKKSFGCLFKSKSTVSVNDLGKRVNEHFQRLFDAERQFSEQDLETLFDNEKTVDEKSFNRWWTEKYWPLINTIYYVKDDWKHNNIKGFSSEEARNLLKEGKHRSHVIRLSGSQMSNLVIEYIQNGEFTKTLINCSERGKFSLDGQSYKSYESLKDLITENDFQ